MSSQIHVKGTSLNDVTALEGRGYQGFCDYSNEALILKGVTIGCQKDQKLRDVIYGRPQSTHS